MKNVSIRTRILSGIVVVMTLGALAVVVYEHQSFSGQLDVTAQKLVDQSAAAWENARDLETQKLGSAAVALESNATIESQFAARNRTALYETSKPLLESLKSSGKITQVNYVLDDGSVFLSVSSPDAKGQKVSGGSFDKAKNTGEAASGVDLTKSGAYVTAIAPFVTETGEKIGYIQVGQELNAFVDGMKNATGAEYALMLDKNAMDADKYAKQRQVLNLANNWDERENYVLAAVTNDGVGQEIKFNADAASVPEMGKVVGIQNGSCSRTCHKTVQGGGDYWGVSWSPDSITRAHAVFPVADVSGKPVGVVYAVSDISTQANSLRGSMLSTLMVIGITLIISTLVIGGMLDTFIFKRLNHMILSIEELSVRVAGGDFDAEFVPDASDDEIGRFEQFFARFMQLMTGTIKSLAG